jgi:hypothetical protein
LAGGFSSAAGGSGYGRHWRVSARAGIGCGLGLEAQLVSASASSG